MKEKSHRLCMRSSTEDLIHLSVGAAMMRHCFDVLETLSVDRIHQLMCQCCFSVEVSSVLCAGAQVNSNIERTLVWSSNGLIERFVGLNNWPTVVRCCQPPHPASALREFSLWMLILLTFCTMDPMREAVTSTCRTHSSSCLPMPTNTHPPEPTPTFFFFYFVDVSFIDNSRPCVNS